MKLENALNNKRFFCLYTSLLAFLFLCVLKYDVWLFESADVQLQTLGYIACIIYCINYIALFADTWRRKIEEWYDTSEYFFYNKD